MSEKLKKLSVPVVLGPTAVGKTDLVHGVARQVDGEIISADSRAVYKWMDIGTATPPETYREELSYHLVNFLHPKETYSAADFREDVEEKLDEIEARGNKPLIVGGSRLYVLALTRGIFEGPAAQPELRESLRNRTNEELLAKLESVDPVSAEKIHQNDTKRLVRALEVYEVTGRPISELKEQAQPLPANLELIKLNRPREVLYERIESRVEQMFNRGLLEEVKRLVEKGFGQSWGSWETIGYKEVALYLAGEYELQEAKEEIKKNTRHLGKYQQNWMEKVEGGEELNLQQLCRPEKHLLDLVTG